MEDIKTIYYQIFEYMGGSKELDELISLVEEEQVMKCRIDANISGCKKEVDDAISDASRVSDALKQPPLTDE